MVELGEVRQLIDSQTYKEVRGHVRGQTLKPYKKPKLYNAGGKLVDENGKPTKWFVYYSFLHPDTGDFKRIKVYLDLNSLKTKKERNEYAAEMIIRLTALLESGYNPFAEDTEQLVGQIENLHQAIPAYLDAKKTSVRPKTLTGYRSSLNTFSEWTKERELYYKPLKTLTPLHIEQYFQWGRSVKKWAATTHNSELATIRAFFAYWHMRGFMATNIARDIKRLAEEVGLHVAYSDEQMQLITGHLKQLDTPAARQLYQFIQWLYYTCIRPKELLALKVSDIRLQASTILVPANVSKSKRAEPVDISPGLTDVIKSMGLADMPPNYYVFGNQGAGVPGNYFVAKPGAKPVGVNYFSEFYRTILRELGIGEEYTLYGWKHTRNIHLWLQTRDLMRIMRHNRHTDPKVTMKYMRGLGLLIDSRLDDERRI